MFASLSLLTLSALAAPGPLPAAQECDLPFRVVAIDRPAALLELAVDPAAVRALAARQHASFANLPLPDGSMVAVELERLAIPAMGLRVDDNPRPDLLTGLELSIWKGHVVGESASEVALSVSLAGLQGWLQYDGELFHLVSDAPDSVWFLSESALVARGLQRQDACLSEDLPGYQEAVARTRALAATKAFGSPALYECKLAIETDFQLFQRFNNNLQAETVYVMSLLTWVAYRYEEQIGVQITYPYVKFYTGPNDPWHSQDSGGSSIDLLLEFQAAWQNNLPAGAELASFLSGAGLGGGVAWLPGLCNAPYNFSVCGNIDGSVSFPIQVSPSNWDFMVVAHEIGHNFGSPHTHDYCPPLDQCAPAGYFGQCQTQQVCTNQGTLMSYCHLCSGGLANVTTYFHTSNVADMRAWVEATCLPLYCNEPLVYCTAKLNSQLCIPSIGWNGHPTLTGLDDFELTADSVLNNKIAIMIYGWSAAAIPFQGGTICVGSPFLRSAPLASLGNPPPDDCSGQLTFPWTHAGLSAPNLGAGTTVFAQFWYRDGASPLGSSGFTDALTFTICN